MSIALHLDVNDTATASIAEKMAKCSPRRLGAIIGRPASQFWRDRLKSLPPNRRFPSESTGFWEKAARSVTHVPREDGVMLRADHQGLRQRLYGGRITPVKAKALTIPISPVSYGRRASEFPGLFLLQTGKGAFLVQHGTSVSAKTGRSIKITKAGGNSSARRLASLNFLFKLVGGVDQQPNPAVVPSNDEFAEVAMARIEEAVK